MKLFVAMELFSHWYRDKRGVLLSFWMPVGFYHRLNLELLLKYLTRGMIYPCWIHSGIFFLMEQGDLMITWCRGVYRMTILIGSGAGENCAVWREPSRNRCTGGGNHVCLGGLLGLKWIFYEVKFRFCGSIC